MVVHLVGLIAALAIVGAPGRAGAGDVVIEVDAGARARHETPVTFSPPASLNSAGRLVLEDTETGARIDVQSFGPAGRAFILRDLPAGARRRFRLIEARGAAETSVTCVDDGKGVTVRVGKHDVLTYNYATIEPPRGMNPVYRRSGFVHPLTTPSGRVVTADFPPDHAHQHGLFFAWVNTTFNGHHVDFWNQPQKTGRVRHLDFMTGAISGPVCADVLPILRHEDITAAAAPVPVLTEPLLLRVYNVSEVHLVDFVSTQTCAGARPLEINKYHYGGLGLRGPDAWFDPKAQGEDPPDPLRCGQSDFLTSEGKTRANGNHTRPRWVDLYGKLDGAFAGVAVLDHPTNFRSPQPVRLHPNKPYLSLAPEVEGSFRIEPGKTYRSWYRLVIHDGPPDPKRLDALWHDFAEPPTVKVITER